MVVVLIVCKNVKYHHYQPLNFNIIAGLKIPY